MPIAAEGWPLSPRILVVEDEAVIASFIADVLHGEGMDVEVVLDARDALGKIPGGTFDLMICDLLMPGIDGLTLFSELERQSHPLSRRTLFITGAPQAGGNREFLHARGLKCLLKPFRVEELIAAVRRTLAEHPLGIAPLPREEDKCVTES